MRERIARRWGGVSDPHFSHRKEVAFRIQRFPSEFQRLQGLGFSHSWGVQHVLSRLLNTGIECFETDAIARTKRVDGRASVFKIAEHLSVDVIRTHAHAFGCHAVRSRKQMQSHAFDFRCIRLILHRCHPGRNGFQSPQASGRFGSGIPVLKGFLERLRVRRNQRADRICKMIES